MAIERCMDKISVVFPLYNEEKRLNNLFKGITIFNEYKNTKSYEFIFVDDGSIDETSIKISKFIREFKKNKHKYILIKSKKNFGKGHALKLGVNKANYNWIFTMDADLSVDLVQTIKWFNKYSFKDSCAYFGSRNHPLSKLKFRYYRKIIGHLFQFFVYFFIDENITDTQCGFKLYNKKYAKHIFKKLSIFGYAHDIELIHLLKLKNIQIIELPLKWVHMDNGKVNIFLDPIRMLIDILLIKFRYNFKKTK